MNNQIPSFSNRRTTDIKRRWLKIAAYVLVAITGFSIAFFGSLTWELLSGVSRQSDLKSGRRDDVIAAPKPTIDPDQPLNILLLGVDGGVGDNGGRGRARSDTIMLLSIDPLTDDVGLLSIPRDTRVTIPVEKLEPAVRNLIRQNPTRIGHAYAYGGPQAAMVTVSSLLNVPVQRYIRVNLESFINIVNILGGVDLCVEKDMYYEDPYQDLVINLKKGCQRLDGQKAMQYVRYRQDSDLARIQRQQNFLTALAQQSLSLSIIPKLPELVDEIIGQVETDLSEAELLRLITMAGKFARNFSPESVQKATVPGKDLWLGSGSSRAYYYAVDQAGLESLVDSIIWRLPNEHEVDEHENPVKIAVNIGEVVEGTERVEHFLERLEQFGYEVIIVDTVGAIDNVKEPEIKKRSELILHNQERITAKKAARYLAHAFDIQQIYYEPNAKDDADLSLTLIGDEGQ